jgi:aminoglycoside phosphotransferase (APT) family kinase protein
MLESMNDVLAHLHSLNPAAIGMERLKSKSDKTLMERQIRAWWQSYEETTNGKVDVNGFDLIRMRDWLLRHIPKDTRYSPPPGLFMAHLMILSRLWIRVSSLN